MLREDAKIVGKNNMGDEEVMREIVQLKKQLGMMMIVLLKIQKYQISVWEMKKKIKRSIKQFYSMKLRHMINILFKGVKKLREVEYEHNCFEEV